VRYPNGQPIRVSTTITDLTGTLVNAGSLSLTVQKPDVTQQVYSSPVNDSTGKYHQDIPATDLTQNGHYLYVWTATGTGAGVSRGDFDVFDPFEPAILPLQDAKDALNIPQATTSYDAELQIFVDAVTADMEQLTGGPAVNRTIVERVELAKNNTILVLRKRPVVSVTSVVDLASGVSLSLTDIEIDTNAGIVRRKLEFPWLVYQPYCTATYVAGWGTAVPAAFNLAARIVVQHLWRTQRGPYTRGYGGQPDETLLPGMAFAWPNAALEILAPYRSEAFV
jgi:hypothetical protein